MALLQITIESITDNLLTFGEFTDKSLVFWFFKTHFYVIQSALHVLTYIPWAPEKIISLQIFFETCGEPLTVPGKTVTIAISRAVFFHYSEDRMSYQ